jgi:polyvinyl alcohol dehydrogenase (cytochrome)
MGAAGSNGVDVVPADPNDWPMYNHDPAGTRDNSAEHTLSPATVGGLQVKWTFPTVGAVAGTPAVVNDVVYAADSEGWVYAVGHDGNELWRHHVAVTSPASDILPFTFGLKVTTSLLVTDHTVVFGDLGGTVHGLDVSTAWATSSSRTAVTPSQWSAFRARTLRERETSWGDARPQDFRPAFFQPLRAWRDRRGRRSRPCGTCRSAAPGCWG